MPIKLIHLVTSLFFLCGAQIGISSTKTSSQHFSKHKGFMVFLNWYFNQPPPYLVTNHFKKTIQKGPWKIYKGKYGGFQNVEIGVCRGKIVEVRATTKALPGGIKKFTDTWLNPKVKEMLSEAQDTSKNSQLVIKDPSKKAFCQAYARNHKHPSSVM